MTPNVAVFLTPYAPWPVLATPAEMEHSDVVAASGNMCGFAQRQRSGWHLGEGNDLTQIRGSVVAWRCDCSARASVRNVPYSGRRYRRNLADGNRPHRARASGRYQEDTRSPPHRHREW